MESDIYPIPNASYIINPLEDYNISMFECIDYQIQANFFVLNDTICSGQTIQFFNSSVGLIDSISWDFEGGKPESSSQRNPAIFYDTVGEFSVRLIIKNRLYSDTIFIDDFVDVRDCSGFQEFSKKEFNVYPNPGDGNFEVILPGEGTYNISVYDITGQMVHTATLSKTQTVLDITSLKSGVYIVCAKNGVQDYKERVIIK